MRCFLLIVCVVALVMLAAPSESANIKSNHTQSYRPMELPHPPANPVEIGSSMYQAAAVGTTLLGWWQFDGTTGQPDEQGWTNVDGTASPRVYFHVDGPDCHAITAIAGEKSMWCGQWTTTEAPWCGWAALPGYGNEWKEQLVSEDIAPTASISYTVTWDTESGYDFAWVEYFDDVGQTWVQHSGANSGTGYFDDAGGPLTETLQIPDPAGSAPLSSTKIRFRFVADPGWSDEDGYINSDEGALKVDDITVVEGSNTHFEDFEDEACDAHQTGDGFWTAATSPGYGLYAQLHSAATIAQEDPCLRPLSNLWGFFDDPVNTNYACGGWPLQGAMPYGPDDNGLYIRNEIWTPWIPVTGSGGQYTVDFLTYRDLPLDNLQFYRWAVRSRGVPGDCAEWFSDDWVYYGGGEDWIRRPFDMGPFIPGTATEMQVALAAWDLCSWWCGIYGTGSCHSHAPLIDQVRVVRIDTQGPLWNVRQIELWQDNFPEEGGIDPASSFTRCDIAWTWPGSPPGDSLVIEVSDPQGLADDHTGGRSSKAVYAFVRVTDRDGNPKTGKNGLAIQSPDNQAWAGDAEAGLLRWPYVPGLAPTGWSAYRMDFAYTEGGVNPENMFCCDLMDLGFGPTGPHYNHPMENSAANTGIFTPGDVIRYFLGAKNTLGQWSYWHRTFNGQGDARRTVDINEAIMDPCEWSVLPDAGRLPGEAGDILFVDDADDRGGPAQLYFDWAFKYLGIEDRVDRFDVLGPSSIIGNSLASRVKSIYDQVIGDPVEVYQKILWNTSDLSAGLVTDDDWSLLDVFLNQHTNHPGVYLAGDHLAEEWVTQSGTGAVNVRSTWMNFNLVHGDHKASGVPVSPRVTSSAGSPIGPPAMIAYGGCPVLNRFDVLQPMGGAISIMDYPSSGQSAVVGQTAPNAGGTIARVVLSGFAYNFIRDDTVGETLDRVTHLRDILMWFENIVPEPIGVDRFVFENRLEDAYPNPFNPGTTICYGIAAPGPVSLRIYNAAGQLVRTLVDEVQSPQRDGFRSTWNGMNNRGQPVSSGVYFYKLSAEGFSQTKKMVLLK